MQVTETHAEGLKRSFTVVLPAADLESRRSLRFADLGKTVRLPGFRPGKVPLAVLRQRFGPAVNAEVVEQSVTDATRQMLSERGLRAALQPRVDLLAIDPTRDVEFKLEVELMPDIALPDLAAIELIRLKAEASAEAIDKALADIATRNREWTDLTPDELGERGAEAGESLVVDYVGQADGAEFPGGRGTAVRVELGGTGFIPGFAEQLHGMRPGDTRTISVTFPDPYPLKQLAGKPVQFEVHGKSVGRASVPAVDEALAKKLGFETLDEMREVIRNRIQREYDQLSRLVLRRRLLDRLNGLVSFPSPEGMVSAEFNNIWARWEAERDQGRLDDTDKGKDEATLRDEYRAIAERRVRLGLLLSEIARVNAISVGSDEMARAVRAEASRYPGREAQMMEFFRANPAAAESLRGPIFEEKVVDFVLELTRLTDQTVSPEELTKEAASLDPAPSAGAGES